LRSGQTHLTQIKRSCYELNLILHFLWVKLFALLLLNLADLWDKLSLVLNDGVKLGKEKERQKHDLFIAINPSLGNSSTKASLLQSAIKYSAFSPN